MDLEPVLKSVPADAYQIGVVCALPKEMTAVVAMFDEEHAPLKSKDSRDHNSYALGRIGEHNVVVACLPDGIYGLTSATAVGKDLTWTFPSVRLGLLVGIGGGVPNLEKGNDIRLGDVVVSRPDGIFSGVVQYDFGKKLADGSFERHGTLDEPPAPLLTALSSLRSRAPLRKSDVFTHLDQALSKYPGLSKDGYSYPGVHQDRLQCARCDFGWWMILWYILTWLWPLWRCQQCEYGRVNRPPRSDVRPRIHYGTIASANLLVRNAAQRDHLGRTLGALCVEMEAAGLKRGYPCLVIRGICDYADSQKIDVWQEYAALTAAAFAKELLSYVSPEKVHDEKLISSVPATIPHTIPFPRNEDVVIRQDLLAPLKELLPVNSGNRSAALWGLGGSGKTQIALEFAYQRNIIDQYLVFWVHADTYDKFLQGYVNIARVAGLSPDLQDTDLLQAVRIWLESQSKWLLVLDSADDLRILAVTSSRRVSSDQRKLKEFIPRGSHGLILWTTRDQSLIGQFVGAKRGVNVSGMIDSQARELLMSVSHLVIAAAEDDAVSELLNRLDRLPLAVVQAASYIRARRLTYREYLTRYQQQSKRRRLLATESHYSNLYRSDGVPNSVMATWRITTEYLQAEYPEAIWTLEVAAWFHHQSIPRYVFHAIGQIWGDKCRSRRPEHGSIEQISARQEPNSEVDEDRCSSSGSNDGDDDREDDSRLALARLLEFSFLRSRPQVDSEEVLDMHELVQEATRHIVFESSGRMEVPETARTALGVLLHIFPSGGVGTWTQCEQLLVHALTVANLHELQVAKIDICHLLHSAGLYLHSQGRSSESERIFRQVLALREVELGKRHPDTIGSMADLAATYYQQGRSSEAEAIIVDVLALYKEVLGERHPDTISSMSELAATYHQQGRSSEAEAITVEVLALYKEVLGEKHPDTLSSMASLGTTYHQQGRSSEAEAIKLDVLALRREVLGEKHPDTISSMSELAATYYQQGRSSEAEAINLDVLALRKEVLGERHPNTISSMADLAATYYQQDRLDEAKGIEVKVLALRRAVLGEKHPDTIRTIISLVITYHRQGRLIDAERMLIDALKLRKGMSGQLHPDTIQQMKELIGIYHNFLRFDGADELLEGIGEQAGT